MALNAFTLEFLVEMTFIWHGFLMDAEELAYHCFVFPEISAYRGPFNCKVTRLASASSQPAMSVEGDLLRWVSVLLLRYKASSFLRWAKIQYSL